MQSLRQLIAAIACLLVPSFSLAQDKPWAEIDYGQFLTASLQLGESTDNIAYKGIAIRLDGAEGGVVDGEHFLVFDTDTLRVAGAWEGRGFCDWKSVVYDGSHQTHPRAVGSTVFSNINGPGWSGAELSFQDPRAVAKDGRRYGPLPRTWGRWRGLHQYEDKVVLDYEVGGARVLELPGLREFAESQMAVTRDLSIAARANDILLRVAATEGRPLRRVSANGGEVVVLGAERNPTEEKVERLVFQRDVSLTVEGSDDFDMSSDYTIYTRLRTRRGGSVFSKSPKSGGWEQDAKSLFIAEGHVCFDICNVGVVVSEGRVNDGKWHDIVFRWQEDDGRIRMWIDGEAQELEGHEADGREAFLEPEDDTDGYVVRIGYTQPDFPESVQSQFLGRMSELRFYRRALKSKEIRELGSEDLNRRGLVARWKLSATSNGSVEDLTGKGHAALLQGTSAPKRSGPLLVAQTSSNENTKWETRDGELLLRVPASEKATKIRLAYTRASQPAEKVAASLATKTPFPDLESLLAGGPRRWGETIETERIEMSENESFAVEAIELPTENPWDVPLRVGGFDFFPGGKRAAVCTWQGDVWTVDGLDRDVFRWQRIATGLFQPLGLKIRDGQIYVLGRDQITRLRDLNGDGEVDYYENFNNDAQVTEHFHEFAFDLQTDDEGRFYYTKGGRHAKDAVVPQHGTLLRVEKDGSRTERLAYGFRAPNGLFLDRDGSFLVSDQEGHWVPENRINRVRPGGFYGYQWSFHEGDRPEVYDPPLAWVEHDLDRSPAAQFRVQSERWKDLNGKLLSLSYGTGRVVLVIEDEASPIPQATLVAMPIDTMPTGIMRARFDPSGELYIGGLASWGTQRSTPGGFYRVRYRGGWSQAPEEVRATTEGVYLRFREALDPKRARSPASFRLSRWNYKWQERYGSDDFRVSDGKPGREAIQVEEALLSKDARAVFLRIEGMRPSMQLKTRLRLRTTSGGRISLDLFSTVNALSDGKELLATFPKGAAKVEKLSKAEIFSQDVQPLLKEYCYSCHRNKRSRGELNIEGALAQRPLVRNLDLWTNVLHRIKHRDMPPEDEEQPSDAEREVLVEWIEREIIGFEYSKIDEPGFEPVKRLSHGEYQNTLRDLLGVKIDLT
ncbi:MAG: DUF6797 domain-containing protein [Planctomycetota bacterium]